MKKNRSLYRISSQTEPARSRCQHGRRRTARPQDTLITSFPNTPGEMTQSLSFRNLKIYERGHMMFVLEITVEWPLVYDTAIILAHEKFTRRLTFSQIFSQEEFVITCRWYAGKR